MRLVPLTEGSSYRHLEHLREAEVSRGPHVGLICVAGNGGWAAAMPSRGFLHQGSPGEEMLLPAGLWVTNDREALPETGRGRFVRHGSWFRPPFEEVCADWGVGDPGTSGVDLSGLERTARALSRALAVVMDAGSGMLSSRPANMPAPAGENWGLQSLLGARSLATAVRRLLAPALAGGTDAQVAAVLEETYVPALTADDAAPSNGEEESYRAALPCLSHAREVLAGDVPAPGPWMYACPEDESGEDKFAADIRAAAAAGERPCIVAGHPAAFQGIERPELNGWLYFGGESARTHVVGEELETLGDRYRPEGLLVGPGWMSSPAGALLQHLVDACGGLSHAGGFWSSNLAAENILCGVLRRLQKGERQPAAVCWYAARDRIRMAGYWRLLEEAGARVTYAYAGRFRFRAPRDAEVMGRIAAAAGEAGLVLSVDTAERFRTAGAHIGPIRDAWGGEAADMGLAALSVAGNIKLIERLDESLAYPVGERRGRIEAFLKQLEAKK